MTTPSSAAFSCGGTETHPRPLPTTAFTSHTLFGFDCIDVSKDMSIDRRLAVVPVILLLVGCNGSQASPNAPTLPPIVPSGPPILLAGQSNAAGLRDCCMREAMAFLAVSSVQRWLNWPEFAAAARNPDLIAFVWWQGAGDIFTPAEEYRQKPREVIAIARSTNANLPVRIIELPALPDRETVRAVQVEVARDAGVELIPTADLPPPDPDGHFTFAAYQTVRERIYRSLGR